jgi:hypothetical protein
MNDLIIAKGEKTPSIEFYTNGELRIEGRSAPENSVEFYQSVAAWLKDFEETTPVKTTLHVKLEYFNSSSSKAIFSLFKQLEQIEKAGFETTVYWYHDNDDADMLEAGHYYKKVIKLPFYFANLGN